MKKKFKLIAGILVLAASLGTAYSAAGESPECTRYNHVFWHVNFHHGTCGDEYSLDALEAALQACLNS